MKSIHDKRKKGFQTTTQCSDCQRDAVPRAAITFEGDVFCFSCLEREDYAPDRWIEIESENPETVEFALSLYSE